MHSSPLAYRLRENFNNKIEFFTVPCLESTEASKRRVELGALGQEGIHIVKLPRSGTTRWTPQKFIIFIVIVTTIVGDPREPQHQQHLVDAAPMLIVMDLWLENGRSDRARADAQYLRGFNEPSVQLRECVGRGGTLVGATSGSFVACNRAHTLLQNVHALQGVVSSLILSERDNPPGVGTLLPAH